MNCGRDGYIRIGNRKRAAMVAESILGKPLPKGAVVHHSNGNKADDSNENLVICENAHYHYILHRRERSLRECGIARFMKCRYCKKYDDPETMYVHTWKEHTRAEHYDCKSIDKMKRWEKKRRGRPGGAC